MKPIGYRLGEVLGKFVDTTLAEKILYHSILQHEFRAIRGVRTFSSREDLWSSVCDHLSPNEPMIFLEFGVWQGYSMRFFARKFSNPESRFFGFDSFEGLPERWEEKEKGHFSTRGDAPKIEDSRVEFVKGWFQNTVPAFQAQYGKIGVPNVLVHFDADLYSSTLFLLNSLARWFPRYYYVFDEFPGHETRALYNFLQVSGAKTRFLGKTDRAMQVFGSMENNTAPFSPGPLQVS